MLVSRLPITVPQLRLSTARASRQTFSHWERKAMREMSIIVVKSSESFLPRTKLLSTAFFTATVSLPTSALQTVQKQLPLRLTTSSKLPGLHLCHLKVLVPVSHASNMHRTLSFTKAET